MTDDEARIVLDTPALFASRVHVTMTSTGRFVRLTFAEVIAGMDRPRAAVVLDRADADELARLLINMRTNGDEAA